MVLPSLLVSSQKITMGGKKTTSMAPPRKWRRLGFPLTCWHWTTSSSSAFFCQRTSSGNRDHGRECEKVLRPDGSAAVWTKPQFLFIEGESRPYWERRVPLRNNDQGLHSDERAPQSVLSQGACCSGCALQPVWTPGKPCVGLSEWNINIYIFRIQFDIWKVLLPHHTNCKPLCKASANSTLTVRKTFCI